MAKAVFEVSPSSAVSLTEQIKRAIRDRVASKHLGASERLPSLESMANELGVARGTVERAIRSLAYEGILEIVPRKGAFVRQQPAIGTNVQTKELRVTLGKGSSALIPMTELERTRLRAKFAEAAPGCALVESEFDRADVPYFSLDLLPTKFDEFEDIEEIVLDLYGRKSPEKRPAFDCLRHNGKLKFLPVCWSPSVVLLNLDVCERENVPLPTDDWDWSQLEALTERLMGPQAGIYGFAAVLRAETFLSLLWQNGGHVFNPEGTGCRLAEVEAVEALEMLARLWKRSAPYFNPAWRDAHLLAELFCQGKVGVFLANCWEHMEVKANPRCRFAVRPLPRGKYASAAYMVNGCALRRNCPRPDLARIWLRLAAEIEKWPDYIDRHPAIPLHGDIPEPPDSLRAYEKALHTGRVYLSDVRPEHRTERHLNTKNLIVAAVEPVVKGELSAGRALATLRDQINAVVAESGVELPRTLRS